MIRGGGTVVIGLFDSVEGAAAAARALLAIPLPQDRLTTISSVALPDGAVVRDTRPIRFPWAVAVFWFVGAAFGAGLTFYSYLVYPLITAGKPVASVPPTIIVTFEIAMLGALLATLVGAFLSIGLARFRAKKAFDPRIHEGKIAVCAAVEPGEQANRAHEAMNASGALEVRSEEGEI